MNGQGSWNLRLARAFNDCELDMVVNISNALQKEKVSSERDKISWKWGKGYPFSVRDAYKVLWLILLCFSC